MCCRLFVITHHLYMQQQLKTTAIIRYRSKKFTIVNIKKVWINRTSNEQRLLRPEYNIENKQYKMTHHHTTETIHTANNNEDNYHQTPKTTNTMIITIQPQKPQHTVSACSTSLASTLRQLLTFLISPIGLLEYWALNWAAVSCSFSLVRNISSLLSSCALSSIIWISCSVNWMAYFSFSGLSSSKSALFVVVWFA